MELVTINGQVGVSSLKRNKVLRPSLRGLSSFQRPIFEISLRRKNLKQGRIFCVRTLDDLCKGGAEERRLVDNEKFIEKQFEFQPMFGEYLKAMESVKSGREKKPIREAKPRKRSVVKDVLRAPSVEEEEEIENLDENKERMRFKSDGYSRHVKNNDSVVGDGSSKKSSIEFGRKVLGRSNLNFSGEANGEVNHGSERISKRGGQGRSIRGLGRHKMQYRESDMGWKAERGLLGGDARDKSLKRTNGRGTNDRSSIEEGEMGESGFNKITKYTRVGETGGRSDAFESLGSHKDLRGHLSQNGRSSAEMQKQNLVSKTFSVNDQVKNAERRNDFSNVRKMVTEKTTFSTKETKLGKTSTDRNQIDVEVCRSYTQRKLDRIEISEGTGRKKLIHIGKVERKMTHPETVKRIGKETSSRSQSHARQTENAFETDNIGPKGTKKVGHGMPLKKLVKWDKGPIQAENVGRGISVKHRKFTGDGMGLIEGAEENDVIMERAAFKSLELFNDDRDRPKVSRMEMEERIQKLAKLLNGKDINLPEWLFSKMMHNANIRFSDHSMLRVIQILGKFGNWRRVLQVIEWLQSHERFKSYNGRYIYTTALDVLGKAKRPVEALNVFHAMRQELSLYPDLAAYRCIAVILGQAGHMKELFDVIDCMRSPPPKNFKTGVLDRWNPCVEPDHVIYNAVLNACVRRKQWEGAFWVLQQLKQQGLQPSNTTYGLVMEVMFACDKYNLVHEFFRKVEKSSIPNSLNYRVLVNTLWREGKTDEAVLVVQDMERRGIVGSASLYYDLARCLCNAGRCEEALSQIDKICKVASKPLVVTCTGLIQACLDVGSVQNGAHIFKQMQKFCSPNLVTCNIMLKAYLENRMFEEAKDLFKKMLDESSNISSRNDYRARVIPDNYTFNSMLDALATEQNWDDFKYVYTQMLHHGYNFNARRHLKIILNACRAGKGELLETTWKHLVRANRVPPASIIKERFLMKLEAADYPAAVSCIAAHCTNEHAFSEKAWLDLFKVNANRFEKDTLDRLINELSTIVAGAYEPNIVFQNVITSCKEFIRTHLSETNSTETARTSLKIP